VAEVVHATAGEAGLGQDAVKALQEKVLSGLLGAKDAGLSSVESDAACLQQVIEVAKDATRIFALGQHPRAVQDLLGHSRFEITMNLYTASAGGGRSCPQARRGA
jgi:hypothetical protein